MTDKSLPAILVLLTTLLAGGALADDPKLCLGGYCLDGPSVYRGPFLAEHGPGCKPIGDLEWADNSLRYFVPDQKIWVWFFFEKKYPFDKFDENSELRGVFVTKEPLCHAKHLAKVAFPKLVTPEGISVGDPIRRVTAARGRATHTVDSVVREKTSDLYKRSDSTMAAKYGSPVHMYYESPTSVALWSFYEKNGLVHSILVSNSE